MARIIYYQNLDYELLPTAKKRPRLMQLNETQPVQLHTNGYNKANPTTVNDDDDSSCEIIISDDPPAAPRSKSSAGNFSQASFNSCAKTKSFNSTSNSSGNHIPYSGFQPATLNETHNGTHNGFNHGSNTEYQTRPNKQSYIRPNNEFQNGFQNGSHYRSSPQQQSLDSGYSRVTTSSFDTNNSTPNSYRNNYVNPPDIKLLLAALKKYFKFTSFRQNQEEAVKATCAGYDTLVLMPTGGGKSICYQLPAIVTGGVTIVVCPLKSLIDDQVSRLRSLDIKTSALSGETKESEAQEVYQDLNETEPEHKLLYVTPEKIGCSSALENIFRSLYSRKLLARFVIDEAHCVSTWGSDFRPDYRKLGKLRQLYPKVPIMALTATAPVKVREDIMDQLRMDKLNGKVFCQSFNRPNLKFEVRQKTKGCVTDICRLISKTFADKCGIIYCLSRRDCESVAEKLRENGITSAPYHAGLSDFKRKKVFQAWSTGLFQVVCATIAFGMGIDKSNVRFVIHFSLPKSIEGYYQEAGRAGRDGDEASCILYFSKSDLYRMKSMLSHGIGRKKEDKERDQINLESIVGYVDNKTDCRRAILLSYLGELDFNRSDCMNRKTTACDNCLAQRSRANNRDDDY